MTHKIGWTERVSEEKAFTRRLALRQANFRSKAEETYKLSRNAHVI
jgi:hypothetical protein